MPLSMYKPLTEPVNLSRGISFDIRGLSASDLRILVEANLESIEALAVMLESVISAASKNALDSNVLKSSIVELMNTVPSLLPQVIALSADGDNSEYQDRFSAAASMPAPLQIDLVIRIGSLTFEEVGGVKKFIEECGALKAKLSPPKTSSQKSPKAKSSRSTTGSGET